MWSPCELSLVRLWAGRQEPLLFPVEHTQWSQGVGGETALAVLRKIWFPLDAFSSMACQERLRSQRAT